MGLRKSNSNASRCFVVWKMLRCWESEGVSIPIRYIDYIFNVMIFVNAYDDADSDDDND